MKSNVNRFTWCERERERERVDGEGEGTSDKSTKGFYELAKRETNIQNNNNNKDKWR